MNWTPYLGDAYLDFPALRDWCELTAAAHPDWVRIETIGTSRHGRPIIMLTLGAQDDGLDDRPALWIDGGTHAAEWTGVMAALYTVSNWVDGLIHGDTTLQQTFRERTAYIVPCISPDGFQAMMEGAPFLRSTLRPQPEGTHRTGLDPCDLTGDGIIRSMRWRHPAGPWVPDEDVPLLMRHRRVEDDPADAFFYCSEGSFVHWDGTRWTDAPREFGVDLNRNFPGHWSPFRMFGMDGGAYPNSEPESRAITDAVHAHPNISVALSNHTYTGCILTQPYRDPSPLDKSDIDLFESLAENAVADTDYRVIRVHPDFTYDKDKAVVGVWSDTLSTTFGLPGYTLELWNPYGYAGVEIGDAAEFFRKPDPDIIRALVETFSRTSDASAPWTPFDHPQLGPVEVGGLDYMRTIRNPPIEALPEECVQGASVAHRLLQCTPMLQVEVTTETEGDVTTITAVVENLGFLPTAASAHAETLELVPPIRVTATPSDSIRCIDGESVQVLGHLDGWGSLQMGPARHGIYSGLGGRGVRTHARWIVQGSGTVDIEWIAPRAGRGNQRITLS